ncbi:uncharacterized protein LOC128241644 isoform X2 [Mya arenaria]|nr:uncharacterized protein LOC128241644 isoform X2 [Mya arenaria]XP_052814621.1 uncharacterized protein LOC128241644 isoform X2 [Mya arenaria]
MELLPVLYMVVAFLLNVNNGVCQKNKVDVKVSGEKGKVKGSVGFTRDLGGGWSVNAGGWADNKGGSGGSVGVSFKFKRSAQKIGPLLTVTLKADQCDFKFYDTNGDGVILPDEMIAIFDNTYSTRILFQNLDIINENGKIEQLEFERVSPTVIDGCAVKQ